ncbi:MAG: ribosome-binding factor A [Candidatus Marinimicrobia bacterium]|nr:ribosome-binding factor A [Candidatus Neomarinimicrobiota bacterium]
MDIFTKNKPFDRNERFSNEIMKVLNDIFIRELELSSLGFITIKNVSITKDLKIAKIYISSINSKLDNKEIIKYFIKNKKLIRGFLGKNIKSRNVPELRFFYDDSNEIAEDIDKLFNSINKNKN